MLTGVLIVVMRKEVMSMPKQIILLKTSKFDWTFNDIRIEKISRFLEYHGPHFEFHSRSFNYSMPKEESSGVIGEKIYM